MMQICIKRPCVIKIRVHRVNIIHPNKKLENFSLEFLSIFIDKKQMRSKIQNICFNFILSLVLMSHKSLFGKNIYSRH